MGQFKTSEISSSPYLTIDFARCPCFNILIFFILIFLWFPTRYAHTRAIHTSATSFSILSMYLMHVLYIESRGFHDHEKSLDLPSVLVCLYSMFRMAVANENLKFRISVGVFKPRTDQIYIFTFHHIKLMEEKFFTESDAVEQMPWQTFSPDFGFTIQKFSRIRM